MQRAGLVTVLLGTGSRWGYLLYALGSCWLLVRPARELLLVPILSLNLFAFIIPLGVDPRLVIQALPIAALAMSLPAIGLLRSVGVLRQDS